MNMSQYNVTKALFALAIATGLVAAFVLFPGFDALQAQTAADIEASLSGPSSGQLQGSGTYTGTITWTGSVHPAVIGAHKYQYEFVATSPSGDTQTSGRINTFSSPSPRSFTHTFNFNESGSWRVCFTGWLVFTDGSKEDSECMTTSVTGGDNGDPGDTVEDVRVEITANPNVIFRGDSSKLIWNSDNANRCVASGGWTGEKSLDGSQFVSPTKTTTYIITCENSEDSASDSVTVVVKEREEPKQEICGDGIDNDGDGLVDENCPTPEEICGDGIDNDGDGRVDENCPVDGDAPTVTITANPSTIFRGDTSVLTWNSNDADSCVASNGWSGSKSLDGSQTVSPSNDTTYRITCTNEFGSDSDTTTVHVNERPDEGEPPTVDIDANPRHITEGDSSTLFWNSNDADTCNASGGWSGNVSRDGSRSVSPTHDTTYRITCTNEFGSAADSVTVFVSDRDDDDDDDDRGNININVNVENNNNNENNNENIVERDNSPRIVFVPAPAPRPTYRPPVYHPPTYRPPVVTPRPVKPAVYTPTATCPCENQGGIVINNSNTINLDCTSGTCRPVTNGSGNSASNGDGYTSNGNDRDGRDNDSGFLAGISFGGIGKTIGLIFLFIVGLLLLGLLVYIILEFVRTLVQRDEDGNGERQMQTA